MRTLEQVAADDALTAAIEKTAIAYGWGDEQVLMDYMVITVHQHIDDDGDSHTTYGNLYRDSDVPNYRAFGMLEASKIQVTAGFEQGDD